jgi:hypothetical protein
MKVLSDAFCSKGFVPSSCYTFHTNREVSHHVAKCFESTQSIQYLSLLQNQLQLFNAYMKDLEWKNMNGMIHTFLVKVEKRKANK